MTRYMPGWDEQDERPPLIGLQQPVRERGPARGSAWLERNRHRRQVASVLLEAGDYARAHWARAETGTRTVGAHTLTSYTYLDGPAEGCEAVDPWRVAEAVGACSAGWGVSLRRHEDGHMGALALPHRCRRGTVCPVCAAIDATSRSLALRVVVGELLDQGYQVVHATFTQRACPDEPLASALDRLRRSWHLMTRGRPGQTWRGLVRGVYWGDEVTRGRHGRWWHAHRHAILVLAPGLSAEEARGLVLAMWLGASTRANRTATMPEYAADAAAYQDGRWWHPVTNNDELYQAAKYPTVSTDLDAPAMAEYLAVALGRHWHHGSGLLWRIRQDAARIEEARLLDALEDDQAEPIDLGVNISSMAPHEAPRLDDVELGSESRHTFVLVKSMNNAWMRGWLDAQAAMSGGSVSWTVRDEDGSILVTVTTSQLRTWLTISEALCREKSEDS